MAVASRDAAIRSGGTRSTTSDHDITHLNAATTGTHRRPSYWGYWMSYSNHAMANVPDDPGRQLQRYQREWFQRWHNRYNQHAIVYPTDSERTAGPRLLAENSAAVFNGKWGFFYLGAALALGHLLFEFKHSIAFRREGDTFDLFESASLEGRFDSIALPALRENLMWDTSRLYTTGVLSIVEGSGVPGDYNGDGKVDQSDLNLVLLNWGASTEVPPTGWTSNPPTGLIDQDELNGVLLHWGFGTADGGIGTSGTVPEPATLALSILVSLIAALWWKAGHVARLRHPLQTAQAG